MRTQEVNQFQLQCICQTCFYPFVVPLFLEPSWNPCSGAEDLLNLFMANVEFEYEPNDMPCWWVVEVEWSFAATALAFFHADGW